MGGELVGLSRHVCFVSAILTVSVLIGSGCVSDETSEICAAEASELTGLCPAGTALNLEAQGSDRCEGAVSGEVLGNTGSGEASGVCSSTGSCLVFCEVVQACPCGIETITSDAVVCKADCGEACSTPDMTQCVGDQVRTCGADGLWGSPVACPSGEQCSSESQSCAPLVTQGCRQDQENNKRCAQGVLQRCNNGAWIDVEACGQGCQDLTQTDAQCIPDPSCTDGTRNGAEEGVDCGGDCPNPCSECANGVREGNETCDDGNLVPGDGCNSDCAQESGWICTPSVGTDGPDVCSAECGDRMTVPGQEECDEGGMDSATCDGDCTLVVCGDGRENTAAGEACDPGAIDTETATCDSDCTIAECGDGVVNAEAGEACDDQDNDPDDGCHECRLTSCGNGALDTSGQFAESCDASATPSFPMDADTCGEFDNRYPLSGLAGVGPGQLSCTNTCTVDAAGCSTVAEFGRAVLGFNTLGP